MNRLISIASLALLIPLAGCPGPYSADGYCRHVVEQQCRFWYQCCNGAERVKLGAYILHTTEEECKEEMPKLSCGSFNAYSDAVAAGRAEWDEQQARSCAQRLESGANQCNAETFFEGQNEDCEISDILIGSVASGGKCYLDQECSDDDANCVVQPPENPDRPVITAAGECEGPPRESDPCNNGFCAEGFFCDSTNICRALRSTGAECDYSDECLSDRCDYDTGSSTYVCMAKLPNGDSCGWHDECDSGHCDTGNTCAPKKGNGESCDYSSECQSDYCDYDTDTCMTDPWGDNTDIEYDICEGNEGGLLGLNLIMLASMPPLD